MGINLKIPLLLYCMAVWTKTGGSSNSSNVCDCWEKGEDTDTVKVRVVGGEVMSEREHSFLALLLHGQLFVCGGSVVSSTHVLTAAHCVAKSFPESFSVALGVHDRVKEFNKNVQLYPVQKIIVHQSFKTTKNKILMNDIALLQISEIIFNTFIRPICLPFHFDWSGFKSATVEGWGVTKHEGYPSRMPRRVTLSLLSTKQCQQSKVYEALKVVEHIDDMVLCAYKSKADSCQGDSGGPLIVKAADGANVQVGIVSFGAGCSKGFAGLYTRVSNYLDWLQQHLQINCSA